MKNVLMKIKIGKCSHKCNFEHRWGRLEPEQYKTDSDMVIVQVKDKVFGTNLDVIPGLVMSLDGKIMIHRKP